MEVDQLRMIYRIVLVLAGAASVAVPIVYHRMSRGRWRNSVLGRHLMASDAIIAGIFLFTVIATLIDYPRFELFVGIVLFATFTWLRIARSRYMIHARNVRNAEEKYAIEQEEST